MEKPVDLLVSSSSTEALKSMKPKKRLEFYYLKVVWACFNETKGTPKGRGGLQKS